MPVAETPLSPAERGRMGARRRWPDSPRVVRLDQLDPVVASVIRALVAADAEAQAARRATASDTPEAA